MILFGDIMSKALGLHLSGYSCREQTPVARDLALQAYILKPMARRGPASSACAFG